MDYSALGSGLGGLLSVGSGIIGGLEGMAQANTINQDYQALAQTEAQQNNLRKSAMELQNRRQQMQNVRQTQYARSMSLNTATGQGAQFGTGLQGAYGTIAGQSGNNALTLSQNLQQGEEAFNLESQTLAEQTKLAQDQANMQGIQGLTSMFGNIGKAGGALGSLASLFPGFGGA